MVPTALLRFYFAVNFYVGIAASYQYIFFILKNPCYPEIESAVLIVNNDYMQIYVRNRRVLLK